MDAGQIGAGIVAGAEAGSPGGFLGAVAGGVIGGAVVKIKISTTQYLLGKAISKGEDSFADLARQCAVGDEQKAEFETTARFVFSTAVLGASAAGMVKSALHGAKSGRSKSSSHPKPPKPSTTIHEAELAGTGLKVKVPVEEHGEIPSASRKLENKSTGKLSKANDKTPAVQNTSIRATSEYGKGKFWDNLKNVDDPSIQRDIGHINKQSFGGGQMRSDGRYIYKFDKAHQSSKVHLEKYKKTAKGWKPCAECDPETGIRIEGSEKKVKERPTVQW